MSGTRTPGTSEPTSVEDELRASRTRERELAALLMLPALWRGRSADEIMAGLPEVLANVARADVAVLRVSEAKEAQVWFRSQGPQELLEHAVVVLEGAENAVTRLFETDRPLHFLRAEGAGGAMVAVVGSQGREPSKTEVPFLLRSAMDLAWTSATTAKALRQAEEAERRKDEFLAMLGHELRNPLAPIVTALSLMNARGGTAFTREREIIERQVSHLSRLVDDLLDISRIVRGQLRLSSQPLDLREIVRQAIEIASPLFEQQQHEVSVDLLDEPVDVHGDRERLIQIVSNLLVNAARYTPRRGRVVVSMARAAKRIEVRVRDNGIGIDPAMQERIFEMFVRDHRDGNRGLGLGLPIVRTLVGMHGGSVRVVSEGVGHGSEFIVSLPCESTNVADASLREAPSLARMPSGRGRRILVVDDNEDAAQMLAEILAEVGHEVRVAHDGPGALACTNDWSFDVALLDIGLPVMNGFELVGRMRERRVDGARFYALTGYGQESDYKRAREAGFDDHFVKPVNVRTLLARLAE